MKNPPKKFSDMTRLALDDLKKVERSKGYDVDMSIWMRECTGICCVCFAGSVMAKTLQASAPSYPECFSETWKQALYALDGLQNGWVHSAVAAWFDSNMAPGYLRWTKAFPDGRDYTEQIGYIAYFVDPVQWRRAMNRVVRDLRKANL